ncbi:MAG: Crp/Fnr family transcriptional regulator [Casimicrobium sp.]
MSNALEFVEPTANALLAALPRHEYFCLLEDMEPVHLAFGELLYDTGETVRYVFFPNDSLISLLTVVDPQHALEVGMVGREGMVGISYALGMRRSPLRALVHGAGAAMRMSASRFRIQFRQSETLQRLVHLQTQALLSQIAQTAACNRFHMIEARLARWLLMTRDRLGKTEFRLTHEFLSEMLGVRRVGVTNAAHALKLRHLIDYHRGDISIIDSAGLEASACTCYRRITAPVWQRSLTAKKSAQLIC